MTDISSADPHPRRRIRVLDSEISYVDTGRGDPIVFLHGNPTSSYLWRNVIPHVSGLGRCLPVESEPADVTAIVERYGEWLSQSDLPKLLVLSEPGAIMRGRTRDFCRSWPNQHELTVKGGHFLIEDSPQQIGAALAEFVEANAAHTVGAAKELQ